MANLECLAPKYVHDIISFMRLTGYYHIFIENVSWIAHPIITGLQKKSVWFVWSQQCQESFDKLKSLLMTTPILRIANQIKDFIVCTDASKEGLGGILTQEGHVICYESRELKKHEKTMQ